MTPTSPPEPDELSPAQDYLAHLRREERLPLADLVFGQARRLERLVRHARAHTPFYESRLGAAFDDDDRLDLARWQDVPILERPEAEANAEAMKSTMIPAHAGNSVPDRTTGTGGSPFHFLRSMAAVVADSGNSLRVFLDHDFDVDARFADIRLDVGGIAQYPEGQTRPEWSHGEGTGDYVLLDINTPLEKQVEWLLRRRPKTLFTWAGNVRQIARHLEKTGQTLDLSTVATSAERCTDAVHDDCRRVFGCDPVDIFGVRELGIMLFPCNRSPYYHLAAEGALIEVITDDGRPAEPGETGRLIGSGFYNFHMPFIRYSTGDYVTLAARPCTCGRSLPAVITILGRSRNRYLRRDGSLVFPNVPEALLDSTVGPMAWQLVQTGAGELELRTASPDGSDTAATVPQLLPALTEAFGETVTLTVTDSPAQPTAMRRKREIFVSELA